MRIKLVHRIQDGDVFVFLYCLGEEEKVVDCLAEKVVGCSAQGFDLFSIEESEGCLTMEEANTVIKTLSRISSFFQACPKLPAEMLFTTTDSEKFFTATERW